MALPEGVISDFNSIINFPVNEYLENFVDFIRNHRSNIINYYSGRSQAPNTTSFEVLSKLIEQARLLSGVIEGNKNRLTEGKYWELIETFTEMEEALNTIDNSSKWLRSAISKGNFNPQIEVDRVLRQFQTLENLATELGSSNGNDEWIRIALRNDLKESDYSVYGGNILKVDGKNGKFIQLKSVVDNISGKKVYGIDIDRKITFENDDIKTLSYDETLKQTVNVLARLKKGDNPEFPEDGVQFSLITGSNRATIPYPIILRQYYNTFGRDDSLKAFKITDINTEQDSLNISFEVETRLDEVISETNQ